MDATLPQQPRWRGRMFGDSQTDMGSNPVQGQRWLALPLAARLYVAIVIVAGMAALVYAVPSTSPDPVLFGLLLISACLMSAWKVTLPIASANGCTLSVADAANIMSVLL